MSARPPLDPVIAPVDPSDVPVLVRLASRIVPPTWGLDHVVAVNPLGGFEDVPFEDAARRAADLFGARSYLPLEQLLERALDGRIGPGHVRAAVAELGLDPGPDTDTATVVETWIERTRRADATDLDESAPCSTELRRHGAHRVARHTDLVVSHWLSGRLGVDGFDEGDGPAYALWCRRAPHDPDLRRWTRGSVREIVATLPVDPAVAVAELLSARGVGADDAVRYVEAQLARLPGWASVVARRATRERRAELVELVALRLAVEHVLLEGGVVDEEGDSATVSAAESLDRAEHELDAHHDAAVWQAAAELALAESLLGSLGEHGDPQVASDAAAAQVVCCIDVRSEPLRRHLEALGPYETFGFAGFFGLPVSIRGAHGDDEVASCPVIVDPKATVVESVVAGRIPEPHRVEAGHRAFHAAGHGHGSGFILADATGWFVGARAVASSVAPGVWQRVRDAVARRQTAIVRTAFQVDADAHGTGMVLEDQVRFAAGALTAMGLTERFAPIVVICAHGSRHRNNPFRSALDCGACGGNPGAPNARILATLCNSVEVRRGLAELGIDIGPDTWFVAAEHETTDDAVTILDLDAVPTRFRAAVDEVAGALAVAAEQSRRERDERLPSPARASRASRRSEDPAQITPDWGLVRCSSIVIGPRSLTRGRDLDRRTFLHSYRPERDPDGTVLEAIMTGPVVVAHWISAQYYFSTVDPRHFGAGSKPLHNVVGRIGVVEGVDPRLRIGLPLESVWFDGRPVHDPLRLLVVIDAPRGRVDSVVARNPVLQRMFDHGWARLAARDTVDGRGWVMRARSGAWASPPAWFGDAVPVATGTDGGRADATAEEAVR